jgi:hypothetical protein
VTDYAEDAKLFKPAQIKSARNIKSKAKNDARQARID